MTEHIHYLVENPEADDELLYPSEVGPDLYPGPGSFYIVGVEGSTTGDSYSFRAFRGEELIDVVLTRRRDQTEMFQADVEGVGSFLFRELSPSKKQMYVGTSTPLLGLVVIAQLQPCCLEDLKRACRDHDFFFAGFSPPMPP